MLQGKTDQQVLYFQSNERALFGTLTTAQAAVTNGCLFRMEQADGEGDNVFVLQVYDSQLSPFVNWDNNEQAPFYKGKALSLNFNPDASITFCLYNTQRNGRDMVNGGAWTVAYDEEQQAFTLKNVALGKYLTTSGASDTPFYWQLRLVTMEDENENGDVNGDGTVDGSDVECLVAHLLGLQPQDFNEQNADINADDSIDISDVTALIGELAPRSTRNNRKNP